MHEYFLDPKIQREYERREFVELLKSIYSELL